MKILKSIFVLACLSIGLISCSDDDGDSSETARVSIRLVDAPGDYDNVFIDVQDVVIKYNGDDDSDDIDDGEVAIGEVNAGVYDLLELTGGASVLLVDDEIPAGRISQIRLILGNDNTVVVDGETFPLNTPSAQQSGLKLNVNQNVEGGIFYEFILDFDADKSIVTQGNGGYSLKPVIRTELVAETGAISGNVTPTDVQTQITASNATTTVTTFTNDNGAFVLSGVPDGSYTVTATPDPDSELDTVVFSDIEVVSGEVTTFDTIELN
jgi:hypothetical protein